MVLILLVSACEGVIGSSPPARRDASVMPTIDAMRADARGAIDGETVEVDAGDAPSTEAGAGPRDAVILDARIVADAATTDVRVLDAGPLVDVGTSLDVSIASDRANADDRAVVTDTATPADVRSAPDSAFSPDAAPPRDASMPPADGCPVCRFCERCVSGACVPIGACDDGNECTASDTCTVDRCAGTPTRGNPCTGGGICNGMGGCRPPGTVAITETTVIDLPGDYRVDMELPDTLPGHPDGTSRIEIRDTHDVNLNCMGRVVARIVVERSQRVRIQNCVTVHQFFGLDVDRVENLTVTGSTVTAGNLVNVTDAVIENGRIFRYVQVVDSVRTIVRNNVAEASATDLAAAVILFTRAADSQILDNQIDGRWSGRPEDFAVIASDDGVLLNDADRARVERNVIMNNWDCGIETLGTIRDSLFADNIISNSIVCAIGAWYFSNWHNNTVTGNHGTNVNRIFEFSRAYLPREGEDGVYFVNNRFMGNIHEPGGTIGFQQFQLDTIWGVIGGTQIPPEQWHTSGNVFSGNVFGGGVIMRPMSLSVGGGANTCSGSVPCTL